MKALKLSLTDFRNYERQDIEFGDGVNIIFGDNAQGKTNILEAVYFFAMGKSNRARRDAELIRHGAPQFLLNSRIRLKRTCLRRRFTETSEKRFR